MQSLRNRTYDHYAAIYYLLLEKLKQQKSQENSSHYLQDRRLSEKLFPTVSYEPQLFIGHSSPNKRASIDCPAGHQYLPDLWKQPKTSATVHLNSHMPSNRPRSYSQGRAVQHSVNLADLKLQQHPPFRELPQLPKFNKGKAEKLPVVELVAGGAHDEIPKICYHARLDHMTMIAPQYSTSTDEGIEPDLEDGMASQSPTQPSSSQRLTYPPAAGSVIKSHSQNLAELPCVVNQYESDLVSSLPSCVANEMKYADCCAAVMSSAATINSCSGPPQSPWDRRTAFMAHNQSAGDGVRPRLDNMSPVSFREGRRASDGLMNHIDPAAAMAAAVASTGQPSSPRCQAQQYSNRAATAAVFSNHKLQRECSVGKAELYHADQNEHETLKSLYQSCFPAEEQLRKQQQQAMLMAAEPTGRNGIVSQQQQQHHHHHHHHHHHSGEYRKDSAPPRSPSAAMAKRFNYTDSYALDKAGLQQQLLQQRLLQHKRTVLQKQGAATTFNQCNVTAAMAAAVAESPTKRSHHGHRQPLYNKATAQLSPQHSGDGHTQLQADGSWQSLPHTMATCQINDFDSQANWLSVPDPQHHWYCSTSGQQYSFSKNYSQVSVRLILHI